MDDIITDPLAEYTAALRNLREYEYDHKPIIDYRQELLDAANQAKDRLIVHARIVGAMENDLVIVRVQPKTNRWYDADLIIKLAPQVMQMEGVMKVDKARVVELAKARAIPADVVEQAKREEPATTAVTIREKPIVLAGVT